LLFPLLDFIYCYLDLEFYFTTISVIKNLFGMTNRFLRKLKGYFYDSAR